MPTFVLETESLFGRTCINLAYQNVGRGAHFVVLLVCIDLALQADTH